MVTPEFPVSCKSASMVILKLHRLSAFTKMAVHDSHRLFALFKMDNHKHYELSAWLKIDIIEFSAFTDMLSANLAMPASLYVSVCRSRTAPAPQWCPMSPVPRMAEVPLSIFFLGGGSTRMHGGGRGHGRGFELSTSA